MTDVAQERARDRQRWECLANRVCDMERECPGGAERFLSRWRVRHGTASAQKLRELARQAWLKPFPTPDAVKEAA